MIQMVIQEDEDDYNDSDSNEESNRDDEKDCNSGDGGT